LESHDFSSIGFAESARSGDKIIKKHKKVGKIVGIKLNFGYNVYTFQALFPEEPGIKFCNALEIRKGE